ncbi:SpoIID/LytB domain-containing protein [candidate division WOR-3 bacterium]|nr:SpoIID/LytB domain-containing protein [candidate division WOR-3 bacterium]
MGKLKILLLILPFFLGCIGVERIEKPRLRRISAEPYVRVLLGDKGGIISSEKKIYIHKGAKVYRLSSGSIELQEGNIYRDKQVIFDTEPSLKVCFEDKKFRFNGLSYRGEVIFNKSMVINRVPLELYLYSVVGCEFNCGEIETMKAGACAARTYAIYHLRPDKEFDLFSTHMDQVYKGLNSETKNTRAACDYTRGLVCMYKGTVINAMYSSVCGGKTASAKDVFGDDKPYLKSRSCNYCEISPHYSWNQKYSRQNFQELVRDRIKSKKGKDPGRIKDVKIKKRDKSGRVKEIMVKAEKGEFSFYGEEIRSLFDLKSRYFDIKTRGDWVYIEGRGWGHGVGMCAWGAIGMAKKGKRYKDILRYYYKGINIKKLY